MTEVGSIKTLCAETNARMQLISEELMSLKKENEKTEDDMKKLQTENEKLKTKVNELPNTA